MVRISTDRKREVKRKSVDISGRRIIKKKQKNYEKEQKFTKKCKKPQKHKKKNENE